jgi:hypothetical protein
VFVAFSGDPWGYMGSKRFLWELHSRQNSTAGLTLDAIDQVRSFMVWTFCTLSLSMLEAREIMILVLCAGLWPVSGCTWSTCGQELPVRMTCTCRKGCGLLVRSLYLVWMQTGDACTHTKAVSCPRI